KAGNAAFMRSICLVSALISFCNSESGDGVESRYSAAARAMIAAQSSMLAPLRRAGLYSAKMWASRPSKYFCSDNLASSFDRSPILVRLSISSLPGEAPRLCRGGSRSLTFPAVVHRRSSRLVSHHAHEKEFRDGRLREPKPQQVGVQISRGLHSQVYGELRQH